MKEKILRTSIILDLPCDEVFAFFAAAENLQRITPPELDFHIITPTPIDIQKGTLIDYKIKMNGLQIRWQTLISLWNPPHEFVDEQLKGPYKQWIHRHTFQDIGDGQTRMYDEVRYRLPLEPLGNIAHPFIRNRLKRIFTFRQKTVREILLPSVEDKNFIPVVEFLSGNADGSSASEIR